MFQWETVHYFQPKLEESRPELTQMLASHIALLLGSDFFFGQCGIRLGWQMYIYLVCGLWHCNRTTDVSRSTSIDHSVIHNKITDNANGVMEGSLSFVNNLSRNSGMNWQTKQQANTPSCCYHERKSSPLWCWHILQSPTSCRVLCQMRLHARYQPFQASLLWGLQIEARCVLGLQSRSAVHRGQHSGLEYIKKVTHLNLWTSNPSDSR